MLQVFYWKSKACFQILRDKVIFLSQWVCARMRVVVIMVHSLHVQDQEDGKCDV